MADYPVTPHTPALSEQEIIRRQKLQSLIDAGQNPYAVTHFDVTHHSKEITDNFESLEGKTVSLAGRMVSRRVMGKASFAHLLDAQAGDLVFFHSTYNAGSYVTHVGILVSPTQMYPAGNPIGYADLSSSYWQQHLIGAGRVKQ